MEDEYGDPVNIQIECVEFKDDVGDPAGSTGGPRVCIAGVEVPCVVGDGIWSSVHSCYLARMQPQPDPGHVWWQGNTTGAVYWCFASTEQTWFEIPMWFDTEPATPPDPWMLARRAAASIPFTAPEIGIVPEEGAGSIGVLGLPSWMWIANAGPNVTGPITRSASQDGYTVTATARVTRIEWSMGDGTVKSCRGPGTPYRDSYGKADSPTCGHRYTRDGSYTVTATAQWLITWSGLGQPGTLTRSYSDTAQIQIAELQVLNS